MEPNFFADPHAIPPHWLLLQSFAETQKEDHLPNEEMEAETPAGGPFHQQIASNDEKKKEALAMGMIVASGSPTHSSAEDIFSDTMELASYLHRRVQEIGKQFRHRPFRITTSEKKESLPGFLQGPPCASASLAAAIANVREPGKLAILRENMESCPQEGERAPSLTGKNPPLEPFASRLLSVYTEMKECQTFNLCDNGDKGLNAEMKDCTNDHLYDNNRPTEGRACNTEKAYREENLHFFSENTCDSVHLSQRIGHYPYVLPSKHREGKVPIFSENARDSMCGAQGFHVQDSVMRDMSPKHVSDANFTCFHEGACLDACTKGKSLHSQCSTPSHSGSAHLLCHAPSDMNITEHSSSDLMLPSLQDHAISDAEDAFVQCAQKAEKDCVHPEHHSSHVVGNPVPCGVGVQWDPVLPESVTIQDSLHTQIMQSQEVAEGPSPHSNTPLSMSSVDSSECSNCEIDTEKGHAVTERPDLHSSNGAYENKSEEIDAISESMHLNIHGKQDNDNGTLEAVGGDISGKVESNNVAMDLLLDAIQVTSEEHLGAKEGADTCRTPSSASQRNGDTCPEERMQTSLAEMFQVAKNVNDNSCLPERVYGRKSRGSHSSHRIQDSIVKRSSTDSPPVGSFPFVRKRSSRCMKTVVMDEPSGSEVSPAVRFKPLQAVSEVGCRNNRKGSKKLAGDKHEEREKVLSVNMGERAKISCLNGKRERTWEKQQDRDISGKEDHFNKQEKKEKLADGDDVRKDRGKEQMLTMLSSEGYAEHKGVLSRRARVLILPNKFSDSVLQPWKKGDRRKS